MRFEAIIFDCDGTLVDSEVLGNRVLVEYVAELGLHIPLSEALAQFKGGKMADTVAAIESRLGRSVPEDFVQELRQRMATTFQNELGPNPGAVPLLEALTTPYCVASNGPREKMEVTLRASRLLPFFKDRIYSAYDIGSWKPEPGLFLHAANSLGAEPVRCAVVEDSVTGVIAGIAAGMTVFGYSSPEDAAALEDAGAIPVSHLGDLISVLGSRAVRSV